MLSILFYPFPSLTTDRLLLRQLCDQDENDVFDLYGNEDTMRYIPRPLAATKEDAARIIAKINQRIADTEGINWAICLKDTPNKVIGIVGCVRMTLEHHRAEMGYMLHGSYRKMGIMDEALKAVIQYSFEVMQLHSIEAVIDPRNVASEKVLLRNQFIKEAHFKEKELHNGQFIDSVVYSRLKGSENQ